MTMTTTKKVKKPSIALRRHYAPIIEMATKLIVNSPPQVRIEGKSQRGVAMFVTYPLDWKPGDFPNGWLESKGETTKVIRYDCAKLLKWFQENGYIDYNATTLFLQRKPLLMELARWENDLEDMLDKVEVKEV